jgi:hypothetical protein
LGKSRYVHTAGANGPLPTELWRSSRETGLADERPARVRARSEVFIVVLAPYTLLRYVY